MFSKENVKQPAFRQLTKAYKLYIKIYVKVTESAPETWGTDAGGSIEVYASEEDAIKRAEYFSNFDQGSFINPGAYKQVGNVVLRASSNYPKSTQDEVIALMESLL